MAFIGTLIFCYCNPDVGNRRGGGRGGPKSREKGEKNNGKHVLLFKISHLWGPFGSLKTWFCMRLIGWCHFRPLTSDLSTLLRSSFCKCCISHIDFSVEGLRIGLGKRVFVNSSTVRGREYIRKSPRWRLCSAALILPGDISSRRMCNGVCNLTLLLFLSLSRRCEGGRAY